ncbi:hypothetical protein AK812_SmicGene36117 [Symbiodinium microadriaticum]|uniref:Uncharacterized protein n=1 Tax=Symbiodinium microadriaticum TaxID=2951 RepID=A0A1Q9CJS3_SYMMI|nr:hypothetical protein AK812_SmicGene36117 [Symbiodinium microadriaticum]
MDIFIPTMYYYDYQLLAEETGELGHNFLPEYVDVRLSPDSAAIPVVVLPPAGMSARELHAQLCTRQLPGWSVAGRVASLEGFRSVCLSSLWARLLVSSRNCRQSFVGVIR